MGMHGNTVTRVSDRAGEYGSFSGFPSGGDDFPICEFSLPVQTGRWQRS